MASGCRSNGLCEGRPDLVEPLAALVGRYLSLTESFGGDEAAAQPAASPSNALPRFDGFQTIERIGGGGMGEVYKLRDLRARTASWPAKVVRRDRHGRGRGVPAARRGRWPSSPTGASSASSSSADGDPP